MEWGGGGRARRARAEGRKFPECKKFIRREGMILFQSPAFINSVLMASLRAMKYADILI
jgi:hypothetical protein